MLKFYTNNLLLCVAAQPVLLKQQKVHKRAYEGESIILSCNPPQSSTPPHIHWMDKSESVCLSVSTSPPVFSSLLSSVSVGVCLHQCEAEGPVWRDLHLYAALQTISTQTNECSQLISLSLSFLPALSLMKYCLLSCQFCLAEM